jgi:acyl carrier protein phosphodiesterase
MRIFVFVNYLAHSYLSFGKNEVIIGNFIADSMHGNNFSGLPAGVVKGIMLHRKIDSYTDSHPVYLSSKHRFRKEFDKYSGVLMDIMYDHFLAKNFDLYSSVPLQEYVTGIYKVLRDNFEFLPENAKRFYGYMTERNIFYHYSSLEGIETVLTHLSHRIRHRYELQLAMPTLKREYEEIEAEFSVFFDELSTFCKNQPEITEL